jgi:hypothetical protein
MVETVARLTQGLELLADLPGGAERDEVEIDLQVALGAAFIATKGFAALGRTERQTTNLRRWKGP